jgi:hypothetical protein
MIYKLEFNRLTEFNNSNTKSNNTILDIHKILDDSLLIHKYKIPESNIKKYQVSNSANIKYECIKESSIVILHLDIYKNDIESVRETIKWCLDNNRDLFIPTQSTSSSFSHKKIDTDVRYDISEIIREYEGNTYVMNESFKELKRDLLIKSIFL